MNEDQPDALSSLDLWYAGVIDNQGARTTKKEIERMMFSALRNDLPSVMEVTFERSCIWDCDHCLFQPETSSRSLSAEHHLEAVVTNIIRQLPQESFRSTNPALIHGGRILRSWHLAILDRLRQVRPDLEIGLIDNGSYTRLLPELRQRDLSFDWLDISLDGLETNHNRSGILGAS